MDGGLQNAKNLLEYSIIRVILRSAVHSKLNGFKVFSVFLHYRFHCLRHNRRRVTECTAAKGSKDDNLISFSPCDFQHPTHPFFMQDLQVFPADMHGGIPITGVHFVTGALSQIRCCASQDIHRIPLFFRQQLRIIRVRFEDHHARRVNAVIVMQRVMGTPVWCIKRIPCVLFFQICIEGRAAADGFFLRRGAFGHTAARIGCRCKIQNADFLSCIGIRCRCFQRPFGAYHSLRWVLINPMLRAIPAPSRARETFLRSTGMLDCIDQPFVAAVQPLRTRC